MIAGWSTSRRNLALAAAFVALLWFAWTVRAALNPLLLGLLFAYILNPMVVRLEKRGWGRKRAVNVIFGSFGLVAVLLATAVGLQARALWRDVAQEGGSIDKLQRELGEIIASTEARAIEFGLDLQALQGLPTEAGGEPRAPAAEAPQSAPPHQPQASIPRGFEQGSLLDEVFQRARRWAFSADGAQAAGGVWGTLSSAFGSLMTVLTLLFLVPLYTWFLLFELERVSSFVRAYIPANQREQWSRIGAEMAEMLGAFFRGRLLVCLLKGLVLTVVMGVLGVPYALLAGMLGGVLALIPVIGPGVSYLIAFLLALLAHGPLEATWRVGVVLALGEVVETYVLIPRVLGDRLGLPTVVVLASLTVFGAALGLFGLLLALPLTAGSVILAKQLLLPSLKEWAEGHKA
ncbi:MAG: AI-2E family transporter [Planctomycetes bacterium]|nr:AI-2E family transporter [Planctomycetota bacterium]